MHLPKPRVESYATRPPKSVMNVSLIPSHANLSETFESLDDPAKSDENSAIYKTNHHAAISEALWAKCNIAYKLVGTVLYEHCIDRESQSNKHLLKPQDSNAQLKNDWKESVAISGQYRAYKKPLVKITLQFQSILIKPSRLHHLFDALHQASSTRQSTSALSIVLGRHNNLRVWEEGNRYNDRKKLHQTRANRVNGTNWICAQNRQTSSVSLNPPQAESRSQTRLKIHFPYGQMYRVAKQNSPLIDARRKQRYLHIKIEGTEKFEPASTFLHFTMANMVTFAYHFVYVLLLSYSNQLLTCFNKLRNDNLCFLSGRHHDIQQVTQTTYWLQSQRPYAIVQSQSHDKIIMCNFSTDLI